MIPVYKAIIFALLFVGGTELLLEIFLKPDVPGGSVGIALCLCTVLCALPVRLVAWWTTQRKTTQRKTTQGKTTQGQK